MKKVASILAIAIFALGMFATQAKKLDFEFDIEQMLACGDCAKEDPRGDSEPS